MNNREIKVNLVFSFSLSLSLLIIGKVKASQEEAGSLEKSSSVVLCYWMQNSVKILEEIIFCETLIIVGEAA